MTNLTEQWKQGKLKEYMRYYCKTVWFENIFIARCHNKGQNDEWWTLENEKYSYNNVYHIKDIEVLAEVPSYEDFQNLKELLKECKQWFDWYHIDTETGKEYIERWHKKGHEIHQRINQVLGDK